MGKKILIHTRKLTIPGGKQSYINALIPYFKNEVDFFFYGKPENGKESFFQLIWRYFGDFIKFYRLLKKEKYDAVIINTSFNLKSYFRDCVFTWLCYFAGNRSIVYWHGWRWDFEKKIAGKIRFFFSLTFGKADAMILLAKEFADQIRVYGYSKPIFIEKTVVEDYILKAHQTANASYSKQKEKITLLFLSRIEKAKGIYETVDSFQSLQKQFPQIELNIAGTGSEFENLKTYVEHKNIPQVNFLGWISGHQKLEALKNADIFILASYSEGMPIATLEAMACGLPVVTTNVGGTKDFFEDGKMGKFVAVKNAADLEKKLAYLIADQELRSKIGTYNACYAKENFSAIKTAERIEQIIETSLKGSS